MSSLRIFGAASRLANSQFRYNTQLPGKSFIPATLSQAPLFYVIAIITSGGL